MPRQDQLTLDASFLLQEIESLGYDLDMIDGDTYIIRYDTGLAFGPCKDEVIRVCHSILFNYDYEESA